MSAEPVAPPVLPVASARASASWLAGDLRRRVGSVALVIVTGVASAAVSLIPIYLLGTLVDRVRADDSTAGMLGVAALIVSSAVIGGIGVGLSAFVSTRLGEQMLADLRELVLARALGLPATLLEESGRGDLLSRVGADVTMVARAVSQVLPSTLNGFFLGAVTLAGMAALDWRLGLAGALAVPAYALGLRWYLPRSAPMYAGERRAIADRTQTMVESLHGARTIAAYESEDRHLAAVDRSSGRARDVSVEVFALFTRLVGRVNRAEFIGLGATLVVGFLLVRSGEVTVGQTTAAALMFHRLFNPIGDLMYNFDEIQSAAASLARLIGVVEFGEDDGEETAAEGEHRDPADSSVVIDRVSFAYRDGPEVLHEVSLTIPAGTRCALVGATGAGKTTLAAIVAGLLAPTHGRALIGGVAVADIGADRLRRWVAAITQEVHVFSGPLGDDLRLVAPEAESAELLDALARVGARSWVDGLDRGLDTVIGEHGDLTAAQAQHIAMARLVLADPAVVVLDEATAEAGSAHAAELEKAALAATEGRTTLVVAHRLSQAAVADQIAVMEGGRIVENGSHADLVALGGRYARLWEAWNVTG